VAKYYSRLNIICYIMADCNVQVHLMRRESESERETEAGGEGWIRKEDWEDVNR
jgi:hypothetical protein